MRNYIMNLETGKIELHFEKSEYQEMSDENRKSLKSAFLWSRTADAWVSRANEPNLWRAKDIAEKLGFEGEERTGERLSYREQLERKAERAEARAERYEGYADNAVKRADRMQSQFNEYRKDYSWLTQPNINSSSGRTFTRQREKIMKRYEKGFEEYRKSDYFRERAETARSTASMVELKNPIYLDNRIKEAQKTIRELEGNIIRCENMLYDIESGKDTNRTAEQVRSWLLDDYERMDIAMDKEGFLLNCLDEIGGIKFSKENIKPGFIINIARSGRCEVIKANPKTIEYRILDGGAAGMILRESYATIKEILEERESTTKKKEEAGHPYKVGEVLGRYSTDGNTLLHAYKIIKTTPKTITLAKLPLGEDRTPQIGAEPIEKPFIRKPTIRKWNNEWTVYEDSWALYKL